ncbi:MAG: hypothetical protein JWN06_3771 [Propionibacteriaceae bacterium]|nr:hypothetical protein [Propionibacteriaceae bacterium]
MKKFKRKGKVVVSRLDSYEVELLESLVQQLVEMVSEGEPQNFTTQPESDDPFEMWARDLQADPDEPEASEDPVLQRLFPNAYPHDPDAASDFRRFTEHDLKVRKISEAQLVLQRLQDTDRGAHDVRIPLDEADQWLRTLTSVRLAVATRLGITDAESADELAELPEDDPRAFMVSVYDWLGFAQETLVTAL